MSNYFSEQDVAMFKNFQIVVTDESGNAIRDEKQAEIPLLKFKRVKKSDIRKQEKIDRENRIAAMAAHYQNPENEGKSYFSDSLFEQVEENRPIHLSTKLVNALANMA